MDAIAAQFVNGIALGALYALVASGVAIIFGVAQIVNFAHGEFYMVAAYVLYALVIALGMPYLPAVVVTVVVMVAFGAVLEFVVIRPVVSRPWQTQLVVTVGVSIVLINVATVLFGSFPLQATSQFSYAEINLGPVAMSVQRALLIGVTIVAFVGLTLFVNRTRAGRAMRAVSQNREACVAVGIDVQSVSMMTFALAAGLAGLAACLYVPLVTLSPTMGQILVIKAFVVVIMGGFGRVDGTIASAFLLGEAESLSSQYIGAGYVDVLAFGVMLAVLLLRPQGLFGRRVGI